MVKVNIPIQSTDNIALGMTALAKASAFNHAILSYMIQGESRLNELSVILVTHLKKERDLALREALERLGPYITFTGIEISGMNKENV